MLAQLYLGRFTSVLQRKRINQRASGSTSAYHHAVRDTVLLMRQRVTNCLSTLSPSFASMSYFLRAGPMSSSCDDSVNQSSRGKWKRREGPENCLFPNNNG